MISIKKCFARGFFICSRCKEFCQVTATPPCALMQKRRQSSSTPKKSSVLKQLLLSDQLEFLMEAHNGLSAKIAQNAGFKAIWGSGLSMSAQLGVRDCNEASWTQILEVLEFMNDACDIPILMDADTGFGNFNNARRLVRKLEQIGIAGACLEDKLFPKTNSLHDGRSQPLADIKEFSLKIQACKDTLKDPDFVLVARVEAFIAGWGVDEALKRAEAYINAGADAILMHSKKKDASQIEEFMKLWNNQGPVILVPTTYYTTPTQRFRDLNIAMVIWANHSIRASVLAMQALTSRLVKDQNLQGIENDKQVVPVKELFHLLNEAELIEAEKKYLPSQ